MKSKVLVAGIGNIFLGDDAFGVEVANRLLHQTIPEGTRVVDFGIRSYDLAYALMQEWDLVVIIDAMPHGGSPGTLYVMEAELPSNGDVPPSIDAHTMNPAAVLQLVSALGGHVRRVLVVGCEPKTVEPDQDGNMGLSEPVSAAVEEAVRIVEDLITRERSVAKAA